MVCVQSGVHWVLFFFGVLRVLPPWRSAFGAGKNLPVSCPFPVKNVTVAISRFYQFSITIALRISAKKDIFPHGEIEKLLSWGSPAAAGMGDWGKERAAGTVPAARMFFVDNFRKGYHLRYAPFPERFITSYAKHPSFRTISLKCSISATVVILKLSSFPGIMTISNPAMIAGSVEPFIPKILSDKSILFAS